MWLRTLMVLAVTSLGIDAESTPELGRIAREAQTWCQVQFDRVQAWSVPHSRSDFVDSVLLAVRAPARARPDAAMPNGILAFAVLDSMPNGTLAFAEETPFTTMDGSFAIAFDRCVEQFTDDPARKVPESRHLDKAAEELSMPGSYVGDALATTSHDEPAVAEQDQAPEPSRPHETHSVAQGRSLVEAFRLTGQAAQAWLNVLHVAAVTD